MIMNWLFQRQISETVIKIMRFYCLKCFFLKLMKHCLIFQNLFRFPPPLIFHCSVFNVKLKYSLYLQQYWKCVLNFELFCSHSSINTKIYRNCKTYLIPLSLLGKKLLWYCALWTVFLFVLVKTLRTYNSVISQEGRLQRSVCIK